MRWFFLIFVALMFATPAEAQTYHPEVRAYFEKISDCSFKGRAQITIEEPGATINATAKFEVVINGRTYRHGPSGGGASNRLNVDTDYRTFTLPSNAYVPPQTPICYFSATANGISFSRVSKSIFSTTFECSLGTVDCGGGDSGGGSWPEPPPCDINEICKTSKTTPPPEEEPE